MLNFMQTTWRFVAGLLFDVITASQHLRHSWLQHLAGMTKTLLSPTLVSDACEVYVYTACTFAHSSFCLFVLTGASRSIRGQVHILVPTGNWRDDADHCDSQPEGYGYRGMLDIILRTEFPQLQDKVYADHAGATMYTQAQIEAIKQVCCVLHSRLLQLKCAKWAAQLISSARQAVPLLCRAHVLNVHFLSFVSSFPPSWVARVDYFCVAARCWTDWHFSKAQKSFVYLQPSL